MSKCVCGWCVFEGKWVACGAHARARESERRGREINASCTFVILGCFFAHADSAFLTPSNCADPQPMTRAILSQERKLEGLGEKGRRRGWRISELSSRKERAVRCTVVLVGPLSVSLLLLLVLGWFGTLDFG
eukprot:1702893-Rhodomonas_salina.1